MEDFAGVVAYFWVSFAGVLVETFLARAFASGDLTEIFERAEIDALGDIKVFKDYFMPPVFDLELGDITDEIDARTFRMLAAFGV